MAPPPPAPPPGRHQVLSPTCRQTPAPMRRLGIRPRHPPRPAIGWSDQEIAGPCPDGAMAMHVDHVWLRLRCRHTPLPLCLPRRASMDYGGR